MGTSTGSRRGTERAARGDGAGLGPGRGLVARVVLGRGRRGGRRPRRAVLAPVAVTGMPGGAGSGSGRTRIGPAVARAEVPYQGKSLFEVPVVLFRVVPLLGRAGGAGLARPAAPAAVVDHGQSLLHIPFVGVRASPGASPSHPASGLASPASSSAQRRARAAALRAASATASGPPRACAAA